MSAADTPYLRYAMFNSAIVATDDLKISPLGSGFMAGEGLFETIRVKNSRPVFFESHQARLASSLRNLNDGSLSVDEKLHARCLRVIEANALAGGSLKIVLFKEAPGWSELILARLPTYTPTHYEKGFRLKIFPGDLRAEPLNGLKSLNYLRNLYAKRSAVAEGFSDALFIDPNNRVLECASSNIFVVKAGVISTPSIDTGILPGVMRGMVVRRLAPGVQERVVTRKELLDADEVFVTNALLGIMPVVAIDERTFDLSANVVTRSLSVALADLSR